MGFAEHLDRCVESSATCLCLGLDPAGVDSAAAAERQVLDLLETTLDLVAAVKPNLAFFEQFGSAGYAVLERLRSRIPGDRVYVLDGKRGDIGSTAEAYARALFDVLGADAVTANPLLGRDSLRPLLQPGRGLFLVARSSNAGAVDLLDQRLQDGTPLHRRIVELGLALDPEGAGGFVAGATAPAAVRDIRTAAPDAPLLIPGVGAQGGALEETLRAGAGRTGPRMLVAVSRGIARAPEGPVAAAKALRQRIAAVLDALPAA